MLASCVQAASSHVHKAWEQQVTDFRQVIGDDHGNSYILSGAHVTHVLAVGANGRKLWQWDDLDSPPQYISEALTDQGLLLTCGGMEAALLDLQGRLQWRSILKPWEVDQYKPDGRLAWQVLPDWDGIAGIGRDGKYLWFTKEYKAGHEMLPAVLWVLAGSTDKARQSALVGGTGRVIRQLPGEDTFARFIDSPANHSLVSGKDLLHLGPRCQVQWRHPVADPDDVSGGGFTLDSRVVLSSGTYVEETVGGGQLRAIGTDGKDVWKQQYAHPVHNLVAVGNLIAAVWMKPAPLAGPNSKQALWVAAIDASGHELWSEDSGLRYKNLPMAQNSGGHIYFLEIVSGLNDPRTRFGLTCLEVQP